MADEAIIVDLLSYSNYCVFTVDCLDKIKIGFYWSQRY